MQSVRKQRILAKLAAVLPPQEQSGAARAIRGAGKPMQMPNFSTSTPLSLGFSPPAAPASSTNLGTGPALSLGFGAGKPTTRLPAEEEVAAKRGKGLNPTGSASFTGKGLSLGFATPKPPRA